MGKMTERMKLNIQLDT